jgi:hypothetical protein
VIDERKVLAKFIEWRAKAAHQSMSKSAQMSPQTMSCEAAFDRGQYQGIMLAEKLLADVINEEEEQE